MTHTICVISLPSHSSLITRLFVTVLASSETDCFARTLHAAFPSRCFKTAAACDPCSGRRSWASGVGKPQHSLPVVLCAGGRWKERRGDGSQRSAWARYREPALDLAGRSLTFLVHLFCAQSFVRKSCPSSPVPRVPAPHSSGSAAVRFISLGAHLTVISLPVFASFPLMSGDDSFKSLRSCSACGNAVRASHLPRHGVTSSSSPPRAALPTQRPRAACQAPSLLVCAAPDSTLL